MRVADFGLARVGGSGGETEPDTGVTDPRLRADGAATHSVRMSATGAVMGTLSYMPLEQLRGGVVDARSDQFAFCVALYEGFWGEQPHDSGSLGARDLVLAEDRPIVPPRGVVPRWVWPVVRRGLARDPERRWPDMRSLLDQLRDIPVRRRTRQRATAAALGLSLALGGGWLGLAQGPAATPELCAADEAAWVGVWDESRRQAVRAAFAASGVALSGEFSSHVERSFDAWVARWDEEQADSCAATQIHGTQSETLLDRRTICLERQRDEVEALVTRFAEADAGVVIHAGEALQELPELGDCSSAALAVQAEPIVEPADRERVEVGYASLGQARAALNVGRTAEAIELARLAQTVGESVEHAALALEARAVLARITVLGGALEQGLEQMRAVVMDAERAQLLDLVASTRVELARAAAGRFAESRLQRWIIDEAQLDLDRVARADDPRAVRLLTARGRLAEHDGDLEAALQVHTQAYELAGGRVSDAGQRALLRAEIGATLVELGKPKQARVELEQSLRALEAAWGPGTVDGGRIDFNLAMIATSLEDFDDAEWHLESATAIDEAAWGGDSIEVARDRFAQAQLAFGRAELTSGCSLIAEARTTFEKGLGLLNDETAAAINAAALCRYYDDDFLAALAGYQVALKIQSQLPGESPTTLAMLHANIGEAQFALGQLEASLTSHTLAMELLADPVPATPADQVLPLKGQALVWLETGEAARALATLQHARSLADASLPVDLAELDVALARALVAVRGPRAVAGARELAREALRTFEFAGLERQAGSARAWLEDCIR